MILIILIILSVIEICAVLRYREITNPAVLHNIMWIISLTFASGLIAENDIKISAVILIIVGAILFQIGFSTSLHTVVGKDKKRPYAYALSLNEQTTKFLIIILFIALLPTLIQYVGYLRGAGSSVYSLLQSSEDNLNLPAFFNYFRKIVQYLSIGFLICFWSLGKEQRRGYRIYAFIITILAVLLVASVPTRNGILSYFLPLVIAFFVTHGLSGKKQLFLLILFAIAFMGIFYAISLGKYWYLYENSSSSSNVIMQEIKTYLSGGIAAFLSKIDSHAYMYNGQNTFRFFVAMNDRISGTANAVKLTNEFTSLPGGISTNVYTFYDFYLRDFGYLYAALAQFIVAVIHGISYKGMKSGNPIQIYYFAFLSYPLVMQFFQDQYISLLSTWLQVVIVGLILFKTKIFISVEPQYD